MTGEKYSLTGFERKCAEIYIPKVAGFEKNDAEYEKLREWIKEQSSDYSVLRRGIIEACDFLKKYIDASDENIQFRDYVKLENHEPTIEIPDTEIKNYLDALSQSLAIRQPIDQSASNIRYRLFLRALSHEWEENIEPKSLKQKYDDLNKIRDIYTFGWIMKTTRNWVSHGKLLEPLDVRILAFLFLINMRAMFKLPKAVQPYEPSLLGLITVSPVKYIKSGELMEMIKYAEHFVDEVLEPLTNEPPPKYFGGKINTIYRRCTGNPDAEKHDFKKFLFQDFWANQKPNLSKLITRSVDFLPTLARHIYRCSFENQGD
jgi:hypothetical protein